MNPLGQSPKGQKGAQGDGKQGCTYNKTSASNSLGLNLLLYSDQARSPSTVRQKFSDQTAILTIWKNECNAKHTEQSARTKELRQINPPTRKWIRDEYYTGITGSCFSSEIVDCTQETLFPEQDDLSDRSGRDAAFQEINREIQQALRARLAS